MHCYTSGPDLLARTAALGAWFSVSGIATFKNAEDVRERVRAMPADRIIVETDCPYLAPVPHRGRRNEPAYIGLVLAKLAEIRGWRRSEAEARTEAAFFDLFDRIPRPHEARSHHPGLRLFRRRAARRRELGRLRSRPTRATAARAAR